MQEYEYEEQDEVLKDEYHDFVTQAVKVAMERKDRAFCDDPRILAEQFLLLVCFVHLFHEWSLTIHE